MTYDTWHMIPDTCHLTSDMGHMVGGEHSLKILGPFLLWFGCNDVLNVQRKRVIDWSTEWMNQWQRWL